MRTGRRVSGVRTCREDLSFSHLELSKENEVIAYYNLYLISAMLLLNALTFIVTPTSLSLSRLLSFTSTAFILVLFRSFNLWTVHDIYGFQEHTGEQLWTPR